MARAAAAAGRAAVDRAGRQRGRDRAGLGRRGASASMSSPTRPRPTTRWAATSRRRSPSTMPACLRASQPDVYIAHAMRSMAAHCRAMLDFQRAGAVVFDYGNNLRAMAQEAGVADAFDYPGFVPAFIRPLFCEGNGPFRWVALSGDPADIQRTDEALVELFPEKAALHRWLADGRGQGAIPGPAGPDLLARLRRASAGRGGLQRARRGPARSAPRSSSAATTSTRARSPRPTARPRRCATAPTRSPTGRCSTPWSTRPRGRPGSASTTAAARGSATASTPGWWSWPTARELAARKLERVLTTDPGMGVVRHVDARLRAGDRGARTSAASRIPMLDEHPEGAPAGLRS